MQNLKSIYEIINFPHEALHKDDFAQTNAHVLEFRGKCLHLWKIVKLHGSGEIQEHVRQIRALIGELVQNRVSDELDRQFYVPQRRPESYAEIFLNIYF